MYLLSRDHWGSCACRFTNCDHCRVAQRPVARFLSFWWLNPAAKETRGIANCAYGQLIAGALPLRLSAGGKPSNPQLPSSSRSAQGIAVRDGLLPARSPLFSVTAAVAGGRQSLCPDLTWASLPGAPISQRPSRVHVLPQTRCRLGNSQVLGVPYGDRPATFVAARISRRRGQSDGHQPGLHRLSLGTQR